MTTMQRVDSSNLAAIGYDDATADLHIRFRGNAATYVYPGVPRETFDALLAAESQGKYFSREIRPVFKHFYKIEPAAQPLTTN